jgi:hypothetical protein
MVCPLIRTPRLPAVDRTDSPADLNGLVHFSERPNLISARVPSRFKRALHKCKRVEVITEETGRTFKSRHHNAGQTQRKYSLYQPTIALSNR